MVESDGGRPDHILWNSLRPRLPYDGRLPVSGHPLSGSISQMCGIRKTRLSTLIKGLSTEDVQYFRARLCWQNRSFLMVLSSCQVQEGPNNYVLCAIIASCFEMNMYPWLNQDSLNTGCHSRSHRSGEELCVEKILWLRSIRNSLASIDVFSAMCRGGTILLVRLDAQPHFRNLSIFSNFRRPRISIQTAVGSGGRAAG